MKNWKYVDIMIITFGKVFLNSGIDWCKQYEDKKGNIFLQIHL